MELDIDRKATSMTGKHRAPRTRPLRTLFATLRALLARQGDTR